MLGITCCCLRYVCLVRTVFCANFKSNSLEMRFVKLCTALKMWSWLCTYQHLKELYILTLLLEDEFVTRLAYSLALRFCCLSIASATILRWTFPVAVLGILSVKKIWLH